MGKVIKVSGPLVVADGMADANMADVVRVGPKQLIGEILNMTGDRASIQVYEETSGLGPGAEVVTTGAPLSVELGPGLIESIYDGIQRPLEEIRSMAGAHIPRGIQAPPLPEDKKWDFTPVAKPGDAVVAGDVLGTVPETTSVLHKIMVPHRMDGTVEWVAEAGEYTIRDVIAKVRLADGSLKELTMVQKWPVRVGRPYRRKFPPSAPLQTGQRVNDTMFPVAESGPAAVPGPCRSGKSVLQQQLANGQNNFVNPSSALYDVNGVLFPLLRVLVLVAAIGAIMNVIPFFFYDLTEQKQKSYVRVLKVRAVFEDYGNKALKDKDIVEMIDLVNNARKMAVATPKKLD